MASNTAPLFDKVNLPTDLFIDNEYVASKNDQKLSVYNPKDGALVSDKVSLANDADVEAAVVGAEKILPIWKEMPNTERRRLMLKLADLIEANSEVLGELTRITLGAPYSTWGKMEIGIAIEVQAPIGTN